MVEAKEALALNTKKARTEVKCILLQMDFAFEFDFGEVKEERWTKRCGGNLVGVWIKSDEHDLIETIGITVFSGPDEGSQIVATTMFIGPCPLSLFLEIFEAVTKNV